MKRKSITLLSLASALAALSPAAEASVPTQAPVPQDLPATPNASIGLPNTFYSVGNDLMGLVTTTREDGTVLAQHYSHSSHSSHSSHYSSR